MQEIRGLSEILSEFDAVAVDQYGVLHDGQHAFPGAVSALSNLSARDIPVVALTNSGKRASTNADRLQRLGFDQSLFRAVVSSGELARDRLTTLSPGTPVCLVARAGEFELLDGLPLQNIGFSEERADLVIIASIEPKKCSRDTYQSLLRHHALRKTPALVANPDLLLTEGGETHFGPGAVAEDYAKMGGPCELLGKPAAPMFQAGMTALGVSSPSRILMIGDSPTHDIAGGAALGMKTLLIRTGVQSKLDGPTPDFVADHLRWSG